jgi:hypothetical protein
MSDAPPWPPRPLAPSYHVTGEVIHHETDTETSEARLVFRDWFNREVTIFARRSHPRQAPNGAAVLHLVGGAQTIHPGDLALWTSQGYAAASFDWQLTGISSRRPERTSTFPAELVPQFSPTPTLRAAVLPVALQAAAVCLSWLARAPHVDAGRLGMVGISWGGYLAWLLAAYEPRVRVVIPAFGCGGLFANDRDPPAHARDVRAFWEQHWEPATLGSRITAAVCYLGATNDFFGDPLVAESLLGSLPQPAIRHLLPNVDHSLDAAQSRLAVAWMRHHLLDGPAVPPTPVLLADLSLTSAPDHPVVAHEMWWAHAAGPGVFRCWQQGPPPARHSVLVFARARYANGLEVCSPISVRCPPPPVSAAVAPAAPSAPLSNTIAFGLGWRWEVGHARFFANDAQASPPATPEEAWELTPARPESDAPVTVLLHPEPHALVQIPSDAILELGWSTLPRTGFTVLLHRRGAPAVTVPAHWRDQRLRFRLTGSPGRSPEFRWSDVGRIHVEVTLANRGPCRIGPLRWTDQEDEAFPPSLHLTPNSAPAATHPP